MGRSVGMIMTKILFNYFFSVKIVSTRIVYSMPQCPSKGQEKQEISWQENQDQIFMFCPNVKGVRGRWKDMVILQRFHVYFLINFFLVKKACMNLKSQGKYFSTCFVIFGFDTLLTTLYQKHTKFGRGIFNQIKYFFLFRE